MVHRVVFENKTTETVTFILETSNGPVTAFTLNPTDPPHLENVSTSLSHEQLRLVVGANQYTNECVSTDELAGLKKVEVTKEEPGNNFVLVKHRTDPRSRGGSSWLPRLLRNGSRNEGPAKSINSPSTEKLDV